MTAPGALYSLSPLIFSPLYILDSARAQKELAAAAN